MRRQYFFIVFACSIFISQKSFCQTQHIIDSLKQETRTSKNDTNKVNTFNLISNKYMMLGNIDSIKKFANDALQLSEKLNFKKGTISALSNLGGAFYYEANYPEALRNFSEALKFSLEADIKQGAANCYNNIGLVYTNQGNYPEALKNQLAGLKIREEIGDKAGQAMSHNLIGVINDYLQNYPDALKSYFASLKINQEIGNKRGIADASMNIGLIYDEQEKYNEALEKYFECLKICDEIGYKNLLGGCNLNIALAYKHLANYPLAIEYFFKSLKIAEERGNRELLSNVYEDLGGVYLETKDYDQALNYLNKALAISKEIELSNSIMKTYNKLSLVYAGMKDFQKALEFNKLFNELKDSLFNESNNKEIEELKAKYETEKKDKEIIQLEGDKQKLENERLINNLLLQAKQDSLNIAQSEKKRVNLENEKMQVVNLANQQQITILGNEKQMQQLQIQKDSADFLAQKAETDKKQEQVLVLSNEKTIQSLDLKKQRQAKTFLIAGLILFGLISTLVYRNYYTRQKLKLQTLRNKIAHDLHDDIGSTLNSISIYSEVAQNKAKEKIPELEMIGESSRKVMDAMSDIVWTINPDNDSFEKIIFRMRSLTHLLMKAKNIEYIFKADERLNQLELPMQKRKNFYLVFKEGLNNLVKYSNATNASILLNYSNNEIELLIRDNGVGFDATNPPRGNGLNNMKQRAEKMNADFKIESSVGNGTSLELSLKT